MRRIGNNWLSKTGLDPIILYNSAYVSSEKWPRTKYINGIVIESSSEFYDDETICFAVKIGWDK